MWGTSAAWWTSSPPLRGCRSRSCGIDSNSALYSRFGVVTIRMRHRDHRFEWTRAEFESWAGGVAERNGYAVHHAPIGEADEKLGPPTQMAVFSR